MEIGGGGGGRGIVVEGKGATFTDAKGFAVSFHPPWISHCFADHVSMSLFNSWIARMRKSEL